MATVYFTRQFHRGTLIGLEHNDKISFPTADACIQYVRGINAKFASGKLDYRITAFQVCY